MTNPGKYDKDRLPVTPELLKRFEVAKDRLPASCFRSVSDLERSIFIWWARDHYKPGDEIDGRWHPVIRAECETMNAEQVQVQG